MDNIRKKVFTKLIPTGIAISILIYKNCSFKYLAEVLILNYSVRH